MPEPLISHRRRRSVKKTEPLTELYGRLETYRRAVTGESTDDSYGC